MTENVYGKLLEELEQGKQAIITTYLNNTKMDSKSNKDIITVEMLEGNICNEHENKKLYEAAQEVIKTGKIRKLDLNEEQSVLIEPFYPQPKMIVLGGGHIAVPLAELGARCGFEVTVIDDRPSFANTLRFPSAKQVICDSFENCFKNLKLNKSFFVVIVTRGHRHDMICLTNVLKQETAYVGMIGSKRRVKIVKDNLLENGFTKEALEKLNAPIGLPIGAVTPDEIAVSIMGQVIAARRIGKTVLDETAKTAKGKSLEFDSEVIHELSDDNTTKKAVVTIVLTKGSSPRHAGAKMIVYPDARILGSIGGGCSESEVILIARDLMNEGVGYCMHTVDMTDDAAEEEGMVCGGTMEVLIEVV